MKPPFKQIPSLLPNTEKKEFPNSLKKVDNSPGGYRSSDFRNVFYVELDYTPEEKEIIESWLVGNMFPKVLKES